MKQVKWQGMRLSRESETLLINEASRLKEGAGDTIFKFGFGQSPFLPPSHVRHTLATHADKKSYVAVQGLAELRDAVASFHTVTDGVQRCADDVLIGPGSKQLIYTVLAAFEDVDVLLVTPSWVSYEPQAALARHQVIRLETNYRSRWRLTPEQLDNALANRPDPTKQALLILNYPGNPDGLSYTQEELMALAVVCRAHRVLVISDEIYGLLHHQGAHVSLASVYPEGTIVTSGLSKWCGAGGWRLGVALLPATCDPVLKQTLIGIASETYSCAPTPVQYAAIEAYQWDDRVTHYLAKQRILLGAIAQYMTDQLRRVGVKLHDPQGGFYLNPDFSGCTALLRRGISTSDQLAQSLLKEADVAVLPGTAFGYAKNTLVARIAYVDFDGEAALDVLEQEALSGEALVAASCPKIVTGTTRLCEWIAG